MHQLGDEIAGRYTIREKLGAGGMGTVYRASDARLRRDVALKRLAPAQTGDATTIARMIREAQATAALEHDHIISVYDAGPTGDGGAFIAMQLVVGETLRSRMSRELPREEALRIVADVGNALAHAHRAGIIHRDIKPDNIMLRAEDERVVVMDFGLARFIEPQADDLTLTAAGSFVGTPAYLAPEQAGAGVDGRTDQFALAVVTWELLAGRLPWTGSTPTAILASLLAMKTPWLRSAMSSVVAIACRCRCIACVPACGAQKHGSLSATPWVRAKTWMRCSRHGVKTLPNPESSRRRVRSRRAAPPRLNDEHCASMASRVSMRVLDYEIRAVTHDDEDDLLELASFLDSVNLPAVREEMEPIIAHSDDSFSGVIEDPRFRRYVFVLRDLQQNRAIGSSMIVSQLGRRDAPYIFFSVRTEERYSSTVDKHFLHQVLKIGYSYDGPTEIGGLVMHPDYRRIDAKLGMQISYIRFLFIAMRRAEFQNYVLAELMPPLEPDGTSHLWEAVGRHFTGMTYREADRLSRRNKEFIRGLFPPGDIHASLLPPDAQAVIGKVGRETRGVEKLLRRIGFEYVDRVDPFDGGPHFAGRTDQISLVKNAQARRVELGEPKSGRALVGRSFERSPWFKAIAVPVGLNEGCVTLDPSAVEHLELVADDTAWVLPLT